MDGVFHSMAMFTQRNQKTTIDYRNYDFEYPARRVPYDLPKSIEKKIDALMRELGLNTGSIDMIYTVNNEYVFSGSKSSWSVWYDCYTL